MHKDVKQFNSLLNSCDSVKSWRDDVCHHHLQVFDSCTEPVESLQTY